MNIQYREKKINFRLSLRFKNILIGSLLGDANLNKRGNNFRVLFKHSENQLSLLKWKRIESDSITGMRINHFKQVVKGKEYGFCQFVTLTHPTFSDLRKIFYRNKTKIVPGNISELLVSPLSLAVWIMDDGAKEGVGLTLQTHSFSTNGVERLRKSLKLNFDLQTILRKNKGRFIIYFPKSQIRKLKNIVDKYILPEYRYKFPLTP